MRKLKNEELNRVSLEEYKHKNKIPVIVILDNVRSMNNIGSVFRTCDAFSAEAIYLCGITSTPPHRDIHKTALGAEDSVEWKYFEHSTDAVKYASDKGYIPVAVEQADKSIILNQFKINNSEKYAIIFGNEINGVEDIVMENIIHCIEIPQTGTKHSLNVSISTGIVLWEFFKTFN
ncbi:MAG: TrmH family RNA methyltransferase [Bacteroidota bacterium]|nr:TrmH family RNA methyltransferase [Bacteroidota bacterium]